MFERDNLSGISPEVQNHWLIIPGKVILWLIYMLPLRMNISRYSGRWSRSPIITITVAMLFWLFLLASILYLLLGK